MKIFYFSDEDFDSCGGNSDAIKVACNKLEKLQESIEPKIQEVDSKLNGLVSRSWNQGRKEYNGWAWLMFTMAPVASSGPWYRKPLKASTYTQLTVNISLEYLYVGLCVKTPDDAERLRNFVKAKPRTFRALGSQVIKRKLIGGDGFGDESEPAYWSLSQLESTLLDPDFRWVNVRIPRSKAVNEPNIARRILGIVKDLYPFYQASVEEQVVLPYAKVNKGSILSTTTIDESATWGMNRAFEYEKSQVRDPIDVSAKVMGYDIESKDKTRIVVRNIEVKARRSSIPVTLTENEYRTSKKLGDDYYLYVITGENSGKEIRNPANKCRLKLRLVKVWEVLDWDTKGKDMSIP